MLEVIEVPIVADLLTMNVQMHHHAKAPIVKAWREAAYWGACAWRPTPSGRRFHQKVNVQLVIPFRDRRHRDPHNWYPTVKPIIDGLTDANCWPDDNEQWVSTTEPTLIVVGQAIIRTPILVHITSNAN